MKDNKVKASIIITTKNEESHIGACLQSIQKQTYKNIECIVVDNASLDRTKEIALSFTSLVFDHGPERSVQRNFGASKSKGSYLFFIDADMILSSTVVEECVFLMEHKKGKKALIIPEESFGESFWARCKALERSFYLGLSYIEAARCFQRRAFLEVGGYDEEMTGPEDFDLHQRIKKRFGRESIGRITSFIFHDEGKLSLWSVLQKKFYYAKDIDQYTQKVVNQEYYKKQASITKRYMVFFSNPRKLFQNPFVGMGMLFEKTLEFAAGGLGWMYNKIQSATL